MPYVVAQRSSIHSNTKL